MSDNDRQARLDAVNEQFKESIISGAKTGSERYEYLKNKKSQADGSTANVVIIKDKGNGTQFTISVNVSAVTFADGKTYTSQDRLDQIQSSVTKYLFIIHEEL
jgi:uncharacterized protein YhfF